MCLFKENTHILSSTSSASTNLAISQIPKDTCTVMMLIHKQGGQGGGGRKIILQATPQSSNNRLAESDREWKLGAFALPHDKESKLCIALISPPTPLEH